MPFDSLSSIRETGPEIAAPPEPWRAILRGAADYIRTHGHCKGQSETVDGRVCAGGAILRAAGFPPRTGAFTVDVTLATKRLDAFLGGLFATESAHPHMGRITSWNDVPERTAAEVIATLHACAES